MSSDEDAVSHCVLEKSRILTEIEAFVFALVESDELNVCSRKCDSSRLLSPFRSGGDLLDAPSRRREDEVRRVQTELERSDGSVRTH